METVEKQTTEEEKKEEENGKLLRMGMFSALAIGIHNFPEGLATFLSALEDPTLGISIAVAIAIHNIPEGMSVSVPIYYATGSKRQAFKYSFLSGLSEPLGAIIGFTILRPFISETLAQTKALILELNEENFNTDKTAYELFYKEFSNLSGFMVDNYEEQGVTIEELKALEY